MSNIFYLDVDIKQKNYMTEPTVTQNDDVTFIMRLTDNGAGIDLSDYDSFTLTSVRPDGKSILVVGDEIGNSQVEFSLGTLELEKTGTVKASVQLYEGGRVSSIPFSYKVLKDLSDDYVPTETDKTIIEIVLGEGPGVIEDAKEATSDAIDATDKANTAAENVTDAGDYANEQGNYAKEQGNHAKTEGDYAKEQGEFANAEGIRAKDEADRLEGVDVAELESRVGDLSSLDTETRENIVSAINENVTKIADNHSDVEGNYTDLDGKVDNNKEELSNEIKLKANRKQEGWIFPDLPANVEVYGGYDLRYFKDEFGLVLLQGGITVGSEASRTILTLPEGYRPDYTTRIASLNRVGDGNIVPTRIGRDGVLSIERSGEFSELHFDIIFRSGN